MYFKKIKPGVLDAVQRQRIGQPQMVPADRHRQIEQCNVVRQCVFQDGHHDIGRQRRQVDHPAHTAVVDSFPRGDFPQGLRFS
ncbi:hypothetical protein [Methylococcus capsulatus]|uniref:hypothetical protein n=1 Tax=Methylococcus capsulatus TaxID=414 RepID=UPI001C532E72|nr:hypothetical protein [Methylococcus capsulatus]QXP88399.1 hypothetical protein KW112_04515 [Methylococcus capsulatus]QXP94584.1 hypothetical protein KW113_05205 [Methylococcus capsulatus]UQN13442.1 hypothetical protein M3M30_06240 [Methylococcus capsulatus]